jgi:GNAT superfamily N-acetyltransferase
MGRAGSATGRFRPSAGPKVVPITPELIRGAAQAAAEGFFDNEIWVWMLRGQRQRRRLLPRHYRSMIRHVYIPRGAAWTTPDTVGAALWFPPGTLDLSRRERLAETLSLLPEGATCFRRAMRWEGLIAGHHPRVPHWYLQTLSITPTAQGRGAGTALIQPGLERADAEGMPVYLETQRESNIPFYRRFGFELTGDIGLEDSPRLWLMWRAPSTGMSSAPPAAVPARDADRGEAEAPPGPAGEPS